MASIQRRRGSKIWTAFVRDYSGGLHCLSTRQTDEGIAFEHARKLEATAKQLPTGTRTQRHSPKQARVYFALSGAEVKIGVSINPLDRISTMRSARPDIRLLGDMEGGVELEAQLHRRFQAFRIVGEWFHFTKELANFVKKECSTVKYAPCIIIHEPQGVLSEDTRNHEPRCPVWLTLEQASAYSSLPVSVLQTLIGDRRLRTRTSPKGQLIARDSIDRLLT
jgi:hypothetical protein